MDTNEICKNCRFWKQINHGNWIGLDVGNCQRHSPKPYTAQVGGRKELPEMWALWPITNDNDFCGDFQKRNNSPN